MIFRSSKSGSTGAYRQRVRAAMELRASQEIGTFGLFALLFPPMCATAQPSTIPSRSFERSWTHVGGSASRSSRVLLPAPPIDNPAWIANTDIDGLPILFIGQAGLAVSAGQTANDGLVFAVGRIATSPVPPNPFRLYAFARNNGSVRWQRPVMDPASESWSSPAIDEVHQTVIYCSRRRIVAFSIATGATVWMHDVDRNIVNASPLITSDLGRANRLFITDFGFGSDPKIYSINIDAFDESLNPYQVGDVVWTAVIGPSTGNSVSYLPRDMGGEGLVFVATAGDYRAQVPMPGHIHAFSASTTNPWPSPVWTYDNAIVEGYFGGVCVVPATTDDPAGTAASLYAATYSFASGYTDSANLVKLNARTGEQVWSVGSNRTSSIPVPLPGGLVALSTGVSYETNAPGVQMFIDLGDSAQLIWETPPFIPGVGGWSTQPVLALFGGKNMLAVGSVSTDITSASSAGSDLYLFDLAYSPDQSGFIVRHYSGVGGSPAIVGGSLYSIGATGLTAFGITPGALDIDHSGVVNISDLYSWEAGVNRSDINRDGVVNANDRSDLITILRGNEVSSMKGEQ